MSDQAINLSPVLDTFTTDSIGMTDLIRAGGELAELMLEGITSLREHLQTIEPGRYTVGEVTNDTRRYSVKVAAIAEGLPTPMRGMRVIDADTDTLESFIVFADQDDGGLMPIDFDIVD